MKEKISEKLGIDVPTKIIDNCKGRFTWMIGFDRPAKLRGQQHVLAAELVDEPGAIESLKTVVAKFPEKFEERHFGSATYYALIFKGPKEWEEDPDKRRSVHSSQSQTATCSSALQRNASSNASPRAMGRQIDSSIQRTTRERAP